MLNLLFNSKILGNKYCYYNAGPLYLLVDKIYKRTVIMLEGIQKNSPTLKGSAYV